MNANSPNWKTSFPIRQSEEHRASRREFGKFLCGSALVAAGVAGVRAVRPPEEPRVITPFKVCSTKELPPLGSRLFRIPESKAPGILIRLANDGYRAFSQACTHLMCPVHFDQTTERIVCPCHEGCFSAANGEPIAGPPKRALPEFAVEIRGSEIWLTPDASPSPTPSPAA